MIDQNLDLKEKLATVIDRATQDAIALLLTQREVTQPSAESTPQWMTAYAACLLLAARQCEWRTYDGGNNEVGAAL